MDLILTLLRQSPRPDWVFELDSSAVWSRSNALSLANCALLAYNDQDVIDTHLKARGFTEIIHCQSPNPAIDTQAYVAVREGLVVVAFRGTEPSNPVDYFTDFTTARVAFEDKFRFSGWGNVWAGWADGLLAVLPQILDALKKYDDDQHTLWITGHSLGGALATVMAAVVANLPNHPIQGVYTYGQPRVGDPEFCARYNQVLHDQTFRHVNDHDLVPHVPPRRFTRVEQQVFDVGGLLRIPDLANAFQHREVNYEYDHVGQLRLLFPQGGFSDDLAEEDNREPVYLKEDRTNLFAVFDLARLTLEATARLNDHLPINPVTHSGYIDRLERLANAVGTQGTAGGTED